MASQRRINKQHGSRSLLAWSFNSFLFDAWFFNAFLFTTCFLDSFGFVVYLFDARIGFSFCHGSTLSNFRNHG